MTKSHLTAAVAAFGLALGAVTSADAALVTKTYEIVFTDLLDPFANAAPPVEPLIASFTLTFDPTLSYSNNTTDIVVNTLNVPVSSQIGFSAGPAGGAPYFISIGGLQNG